MIYEQAIASQAACNLSGLCNSLPKIAAAIWAEIAADGGGYDTERFNHHPVMRLIAEQFAHLTSGRDWQEAYTICENKVSKQEDKP